MIGFFKIFNMKPIKLLLLTVIAIFSLNSCTDEVDPQNTNYITFAEPSYSTGVDVGGSTTVDIKLFTANTTGAARTFGVSVDGDATNAAAGSYTVPTSVQIPAGENEATISVQLSDVDLGIGVNNLVLKIDAEAGLSTGGSTTISYIQNCNEVTASLEINFDFFSDETSWEVLDALGGVVASGSGYAQGSAPVTETFALCQGRDYTLVVYDAFGDGMNDGAVIGSYTLTVGGVVKVDEIGDFATSQSTAFDTN